MRALRIVGRGLKDTYEHLFSYVLASLGWWLAAILIVTLPAGTLTLFMLTDPRRAIERPDWRETLGFLRDHIARGWLLALLTVPFPVVLLLNLYSFAGTESWLAALTPLWVLLLVVGTMVVVLAFAIMALMSAGVPQTLRRAGYVVAAAPVRALTVFTLLTLISLISWVAVVPAILLVPAIIGATLNRLVLNAFEIPVIDPTTPTDERRHERTVGGPERRRRWWGG